MSRVGTLHCYCCGARVPVGAECPATDYGPLVAQMFVRCMGCEEKKAEADDATDARLSALVEGLRGLSDECRKPGWFDDRWTDPGCVVADELDALLAAHGFGTQPEKEGAT